MEPRLLHHAELIPITGRSYRLQDSAKEQNTRKAAKRDSSKVE